MKNYRIQNGCHNCKHCFLLTEYDSNDELYCTKDAPTRPPCGSVHMDEDFGQFEEIVIKQKEEIEKKELTDDERFQIYQDVYSQYRDVWNEWSKDRMVSHNGHSGICDYWEEQIITS